MGTLVKLDRSAFVGLLNRWTQVAQVARHYSSQTGRQGSAKRRRSMQEFRDVLQSISGLGATLQESREYFMIMADAVEILKELVVAMRVWEAEVPLDYILIPDEFEKAEKFLENIGEF